MNTRKLNISKESAGSGKTFHLSHRYIEYLLQDSADPQAYKKILAVTFTNAATAEMKERILKYLNADLKDGKYEAKRAFLSRIVHDYSMFKVSTIDSFFQSVLRSFAFEVGKKSSYELSLDNDEVVKESLNSLYKTIKENPSLVKTLEEIALESTDKERDWDFRKGIVEFCKKILNDEFLRVKQEEPELFAKNSDGSQERLIKQMRAFCSSFVEKCYDIFNQIGRLFAESSLESSDFKNASRSEIYKTLKSAAESYKESLTASAKVRKTTPPESLNEKFFRIYEDFDNEWPNKKTKMTGILHSLYEAVVPLVKEYLEHFSNDNHYKYYLSYIFILEKIRETSLLGDVYSKLQDYCDREGVALLAEAPGLIRSLIGDGKDAPFIYEKIGTRINHFLLDEFQDTSGVQWSNFKPLLEESLSQNFDNLIVGDVKQSIFRWRGGDWKILNSALEEDFKDSAELCSKKPGTNYRSLQRIVGFNNYIFEKLPCVLDSQNRHISETDSLSHIYKDCSQVLSKSNQERAEKGQRGFVKVISFDKTSGKRTKAVKDKDFIIQKCYEIIESLTSQKREEGKRYKRGQIAVLVDTNSQGREIVDYLMLHGVKVISGEAARIDSSDAVFTLLVLLKYLATKEIMWVEILEALFNVKIEHKEMLKEISLTSSVYDICRILIENCLPKAMLKDVVFLTSFIDKIHQYSVREGSDVQGFLKWWNQGKEKFTIPTPPTEDAVTVVTMHKAKGLAYDVVLVPFVRDYKESLKKMKSDGSHWVKFDDPSFIYKKKALVSFKDNLADSVYSEDFENEKYNIVIDTVNLLYVSFTRAKEKLYVINSKYSDANSLSANLFKLCEENPDFSREQFSITSDGWAPFEYTEFTYGDENEDIVQWRSDSNERSASPLTIDEITPQHIFTNVRNELRLSDFGEENDVRHKGILLHRLYSYLNDMSVEEAVNKLFASTPSAAVLARTKEELSEDVHLNLAKVAEYEWFNSLKYTVYAESDILFNGEFYRPDRVLVSADGSKNEAIVIDYKFGSVKTSKYNCQVKKYCKLLMQMGFKRVKGFLWYVSLEEVEEV